MAKPSRSDASTGAPLTPQRPVLKESVPSTWRQRGKISYVATGQRLGRGYATKSVHQIWLVVLARSEKIQPAS